MTATFHYARVTVTTALDFMRNAYPKNVAYINNVILETVISLHVHTESSRFQINNSTYSTCLVVTSDDKELNLYTDEFDPAPVYHLLDRQQDLETCQHKNHTNYVLGEFTLWNLMSLNMFLCSL